MLDNFSLMHSHISSKPTIIMNRTPHNKATPIWKKAG
jgi:hypothetical protein